MRTISGPSDTVSCQAFGDCRPGSWGQPLLFECQERERDATAPAHVAELKIKARYGERPDPEVGPLSRTGAMLRRSRRAETGTQLESITSCVPVSTSPRCIFRTVPCTQG